MANNSGLICNKEGCTLGQTGKCVLDHVPKDCPDRLAFLFQNQEDLNKVSSSETLTSPVQLDRLKGSNVLTVEQMDALIRQRYCQTVGILGVPNSGKTACLVSFYLMVAHNKLDGYEFRDSKTIMAFEEIASGAKKWGDKQPEQFTVHTEILDERSAGFLHVRLFSEKSKRDVDLLLPDVPGEWSTSFIDSNQTDRLGYLKSAECVLLMVNGQDIINTATRRQTLHRVSLLIQRLSAFLEDIKPKLTLVVTHRDRCDEVISKLGKIEELAQNEGFVFNVVEIASFSDNDEFVPGSGISHLIDTILETKGDGAQEFWPAEKFGNIERQMMMYQQKQEKI